MTIPKKYHTHNGWILDMDRSGAVGFVKGEIAVWCSPEWEGVKDRLFIDVHDWEKGIDDEQTSKTIPYEGKLTAARWFAMVTPILDAIDARVAI